MSEREAVLAEGMPRWNHRAVALITEADGAFLIEAPLDSDGCSALLLRLGTEVVEWRGIAGLALIVSSTR